MKGRRPQKRQDNCLGTPSAAPPSSYSLRKSFSSTSSAAPSKEIWALRQYSSAWELSLKLFLKKSFEPLFFVFWTWHLYNMNVRSRVRQLQGSMVPSLTATKHFLYNRKSSFVIPHSHLYDLVKRFSRSIQISAVLTICRNVDWLAIID